MPLASSPHHNLWLYTRLDRAWLRRSYVAKIMAVSFVGVHVPLICLAAYLLAASPLSLEAVMPIALTVLIATLAGTAGTLAALYLLLNPVRAASAAIHDYIHNRHVAALPTGFTDEAGRLMADLQEGITRLDGALDATGAERHRLIEEREAHFEMLSKMSHELRTPLNAILGFAEVIQTEMMGPVGAPAYSEYAGFIRKSGADLLHMVEGLLQMGDAKTGAARQAVTAVNLDDMLIEVVNLQRLHADRRHVGIDLHRGNRPVVVHEDPRALKQLLMFTLSGVIAGTQAGGLVAVALRLTDDGGTGVSVTAPGAFSPADLPRVITRVVDASGGGFAAAPAGTDDFGHVSVQGFTFAVAHAIASAEHIAMDVRPLDGQRAVTLTFTAATADS